MRLSPPTNFVLTGPNYYYYAVHLPAGAAAGEEEEEEQPLGDPICLSYNDWRTFRTAQLPPPRPSNRCV